jgi:hypothetical protein
MRKVLIMPKKFRIHRNVSPKRYKIKHILTFLCSILILLQLSCKKQPSSQVSQSKSETLSKTKPPDLSNCTRVEMKFRPSTKDYICFPGLRHLLNSQETEYLESIDKLVLSDPQTIKVLSKDISSSIYEQTVIGMPGIKNIIEFTCYYKGNSQKIFYAISVYSGDCEIITDDFQVFKSYIHLNLIAPKLQVFVLRVFCAENLKRYIMESFRYYIKTKDTYPPSGGWCDAVIINYGLRGYNAGVSEFKRVLTCPGAGEGKCNYAINPNCMPDSPGDMVLLFETKDGWNQNGGPELFTFDNHDPKGGCVLFNDGTVKFIRTEEELNKLRWK